MVKFRFRNVLIAALVYVVILAMLVGEAPGLAAAFVVYALATAFVFRVMLRDAERRRTASSVEFVKTGPADVLGVQHASFHYVFESKQDLLQDLQTQMNADLVGKLGCSDMRAIDFKDVDSGLRSKEVRTFLTTSGRETPRATQFNLLVDLRRGVELNTVRWWVLVRGVRDPNKVFWRYVLAPLFVPSVVWAYLRRRYNPIPGTLTVDPGFFNSIDVLNGARQIEYVAFEALVRVMDRHGLDTSDLRSQRGNILNINVSGGRANFGSVVQGAMNTIRGEARAKSA